MIQAETAMDLGGDGLPRIAVPSPAVASPDSPFLRNVVGTLASRAALVALGLISSVIVARALGPAGRGEYSVAVTVAAIGVQLATLGLHTSSAWAVAREPALRGRLLANGALTGLVTGTAVAVVFGVVSLLVPAASSLPPVMLGLALAAIPIGLVYLTEQNLILGLQWVRAYNALEIANRTAGIVLFIIVISLGVMNATTAYAALLVAIVVVATTAFWLLARNVPVRPDFSLVRRFAGVSLRSYSSALLIYLVFRLDLLMVQYLQGSAAAGQYSIAVTLGEMVLLVPTVVALIMFPRLSAITDHNVQRASTIRTTAWMGIVSVGLVLPATIVAGAAIRLLYGDVFAPAVPAFLWLLPGLVFMSMHSILMAYFLAIGTPRVTLLGPFVGLSINVALNVFLIPRFGFVGASISSTLAYAVMLAISATVFARTACAR
jgi:antigen flippase